MKRYQPTLETDANGYRNMFMSEQPVGNHYSIEEVTAFLRKVREMVEKISHRDNCDVIRAWPYNQGVVGSCPVCRVLARLDEEIQS